MKHLLTSLIAAIVLVLPLSADESAQTISVRVIDHEGDPVIGLGLSVTSDEHSHHGLTDDNGVMKTRLAPPLQGQSAAVRPQPARSLRIGDSRGPVAILGPNAGSDSYSSQVLAKHQQQLDSQAINHTVRFGAKDLVDGVFTVRLPESLPRQIIFEFVDLSPLHGTYGWWLQLEGAPIVSLADCTLYGGGFSVDLGPRHRIAKMIPVVNGQTKPIGLYRLGQCFLFEEELEVVSYSPVVLKIPPSSSGNVEVRFTRQDGHRIGNIFLVSTDGKRGQLLGSDAMLRRALGSMSEGVTRSWLPPGQYVVVSIEVEKDTLPNLWSPGSVFDTMLRLRRGEELPHLKRIPITEGGTVELSSEDFLDPPSEPDAKDATP